MTSPEARGGLPSFSAVINSLGACGDLPRSAWITSLGARGSPPLERVEHRVDRLPWSAWITFLERVDGRPWSVWITSLRSHGSSLGDSERVDVPWVTLMGWLPRSPTGCQELWPNVCTLLRAHASQTSTKRAGDSAQAQRKGAQRPACVHLCARALLQRFLVEGF